MWFAPELEALAASATRLTALCDRREASALSCRALHPIMLWGLLTLFQLN